MSFFPGDKWRPSASREREITRLLEEARGDRASFGVPAGQKMQPGHVLVRNDSGADLGFGKAAMVKILGYHDQDPLPRREPEYRTGFYSAVALAPTVFGMTPGVTRMGLAVEPIKSQAFGVMAVAGLAIATYPATLGYVQPVSGGVYQGGMFGFAKVLSVPQSGQSAPRDFSVWDLSTQNMYNTYQLTAVGATKVATLDGGYSSVLIDTYEIAGWQVVGDKGMAFWDGQFWRIVSPWCVGATE